MKIALGPVLLLSLFLGDLPSIAGEQSQPCDGLLDSPAEFLRPSDEAVPGGTTGQVPSNGNGGGGPNQGNGAKPGNSNNAGPVGSGSASGDGSTPRYSGGLGVGPGFVGKVGESLGAGSANTVLTLQNAMVLSQLARGNEVMNEGLTKTAEFKSSEGSDRSSLERRYEDISRQELSNRLKRAEGELSNMAKYLDQARTQGMSPADQAFFRNTFANAADKAQIAQELIKDDKEKTYTREQVRELLNQARQEQSSLVDRLLLLNGLAEQERQEALARLNLAEQVKIVLPNGKSRQIPLLHNGYLNSAGRSDLDCPTFIAATLSPKFRKANLTTLDLRGIWSLSRTGHLPDEVKWAKGRREILENVAKGFEAVDLYLGEKPLPGDLLVHRVLADTHGKVAVVKSYDPKRRVARVAEPNTDGSRLVEYDFALSTDPEDRFYRRLRPGLANLRLLPDQNAACSYDNREPSSNQRKTDAPRQRGK